MRQQKLAAGISAGTEGFIYSRICRIYTLSRWENHVDKTPLNKCCRPVFNITDHKTMAVDLLSLCSSRQ